MLNTEGRKGGNLKKKIGCGCLSVIIPTVEPLKGLSPLLDSLDTALWSCDEVIVVQASGPVREPVNLAGRHRRTKVVFAPRGRGTQLNQGVRSSDGEMLLFLHGDSRLPEGFAGFIRKVCADHRTSLGCFRLSFHPSDRLLDAVAAWANLRTRLFHLPYGDQGLFCRRETWERVGGFRKPFLMEDVDFVRQCRKLGRIHMVQAPIRTSPRRYRKHGIWRASLMNHLILFGYRLGIDNRVLYERYYRNPKG